MNAIIDYETFYRLWVSGIPTADMAKRWNVSRDTIYKYAHRHNLPLRKGGKKSCIFTDLEKREWIIKHYPYFSNETMAAYLGLSPDWIGVLARRLGLKKSEEYMRDIKIYHKKKVQEYHDRILKSQKK